MSRSKSLLVAMSIVLSACASMQQTPAPADKTPALAPAATPIAATGKDGELAPADEIDKIISDANPVLAEMSGVDENGEKVPLQIPIEINRKVAEWINFFTVRDRERTQRSLERGEPMREQIQHLLKDNDVPPELFYLAMIESGFVSQAKSRAKAVGVWQFMRDTGRNYGLTVNSQIDERRNWIKATEAAASYLKDLNNVFGSWYLALASYNAGEHRIVRSIMRGKTRDFWALAEAGLLPRETLNYVPKFLAAHIVSKNYKKYGFVLNQDPDALKWEDYDTVSVPSGARLSDIASATGVSLDILKQWNADLIRGYTPYSKTGSVDIYVPKTLVNKVEENRLAIERIKRVKLGAPERRAFASLEDTDGSYNVYVVRGGDSLYTIARHLKVSVRTLMKINGLHHRKIHPGQRLRYYGDSVSAHISKPRQVASVSGEKHHHRRKKHHEQE